MNDVLMCPVCGGANQSGAKFCIRCGSSLEKGNNIEGVQSFNEASNFTNNSFKEENVSSLDESNLSNDKVLGNNQVNSAYNNDLQSNNFKRVSETSRNNGSLNYFKYIWNSIINPIGAYKEEEEKLDDLKSGIFLTLITVIVVVILCVLKNIVMSAWSYSLESLKKEWIWENVSEINFIKVIIQNACVAFGIIFICAGVYYLASLVIKKNVSFKKLLCVSAVAFVPFLVCSPLSAILGWFYVPLGSLVSIIGSIYTIIILLEMSSLIVSIKDEKKRVYYNLICLSLVFIGRYFLNLLILI